MRATVKQLARADGLIHSMREDGLKWREIARMLNAKRMRNGRGNAWTGDLCQSRHKAAAATGPQMAEVQRDMGIWRSPQREDVPIDDHDKAIEYERAKTEEMAGLLRKEQAEHEATRRAMRRLRLAALRQGAVL